MDPDVGWPERRHLNSVHLNGVHYSGIVTTNGNGRRHTRDDVARTALRILDEDGLAALTMRRMAAALDVQPSALYWHFPNKQSLLAEVADRIVGHAAPSPAPAPDGPDWAGRVRAESGALRDALLAYRDGAEVVSSTLALGLGTARPQERIAAAIEAGGFSASTAERAATTLLHFLLGHVSHEQQRLQYDSLGVLAPSPEVPPAEHSDPSAEFAFGVDLLIGGVAAVHSRA